jgi:integrase
MKALTPDGAKKFLKACEADEYGLVFGLALVSGMRPEEYLALQWADLDFKQNTITVQRVVVWERWTKAVHFAEPKASKSRRTIPLPAYLMPKLKEHRKQPFAYKRKVPDVIMHYIGLNQQDGPEPAGITSQHLWQSILTCDYSYMISQDQNSSCD